MKKEADLGEWDEDEDVGERGPEPKRLNTDETPEELARRVMRAGKPKPGLQHPVAPTAREETGER